MVKVLVGDIFESKAQTLVNTVNCVGVMGKGIALEFKKRFPAMYADYLERCKAGNVRLGEPYLFKSTVPPWVLNFPTKDHWRSLAKAKDIERGLLHLLKHYKNWGISSIAFPPLGAGHGQLEWRIIGPILYGYLSRLDIPVELYAPYGTPHDELELSSLRGIEKPGQLPLRSPRSQRINPSWVALVEILRRVEEQPYHWPIGRVAFQKMAYIASEEGLPLGLEFVRSSFGPFSPDLKPLVGRLMNNGLVTEERHGRMFAVAPGPSLPVARQAYSADMQKWEPIISKVANLFMRASTQRSELMATVLFAVRRLVADDVSPPTESRVINLIEQWKKRRRPPLDREALIATLRSLASLGWIELTPDETISTREDVVLET